MRRPCVHRTPCLFATRQGGNALHLHGVALDAVALEKANPYEFVKRGSALPFEAGGLRVLAGREALQGCQLHGVRCPVAAVVGM